MNPTQIEILGEFDFYGLGSVKIARNLGVIYPLTWCCEASAKGAEDGIVCRRCFNPIPDDFGIGWTQEEWDRNPLKPIPTQKPAVLKTLTKARRLKASDLFVQMRKEQIPDLVTAGEAIWICEDHGLIETKFARMRSSAPIRLIDLAVYIARCV